LGRLVPHIHDDVLRALVEALGAEMQRLAALSDRVLEELARSVGLTLPQNTCEREELRRTLEAEDTGRPVWPPMSSLRPLVDETVRVAGAVNATKQRIDAHIADLRAGDTVSRSGSQLSA
jgi:hypothetical protein